MKKSENVLENAVLEEGTRGGRMLKALQHCRMLHNDIYYSLVHQLHYSCLHRDRFTFTYMQVCVRAAVGMPALAALLGSCAHLKIACFKAFSCTLA